MDGTSFLSSVGWQAISSYSYILVINIIFASLFLGHHVPTIPTVWRKGEFPLYFDNVASTQLAYGQILAFGQYGVAILTCGILTVGDGVPITWCIFTNCHWTVMLSLTIQKFFTIDDMFGTTVGGCLRSFNFSVFVAFSYNFRSQLDLRVVMEQLLVLVRLIEIWVGNNFVVTTISIDFIFLFFFTTPSRMEGRKGLCTCLCYCRYPLRHCPWLFFH